MTKRLKIEWHVLPVVRLAGWQAAIVLLCAVLALALAPAQAEARAGSSGRSMSQGSRGSRTYHYDGAQPMDRSMTARPAPASPFAARPAPYAGSPYAGRHPFMTGFFGGLVGAGLAGLLFGHGLWGVYGSPFGGMIGLILQLLIIAWLIRLALGFWRRRPGLATVSGFASARPAVPLADGTAPGPRDPAEISIAETDFNAWTALLTGIQEAWSRGDLATLRRHVTPEMLSYFAEELARNASEGVENRVEDVRLVKGDLQEAWREDGLDYATARLRWSARDYMVRSDAPAGTQDVILRGDPAHSVEATEIWTFVRSSGGRWLLSAIQQP